MSIELVLDTTKTKMEHRKVHVIDISISMKNYKQIWHLVFMLIVNHHNFCLWTRH